MSRELDAEVAEKVMGWVTDVDLLDFHPSDTIADAWEVVEKMREMAWAFHCSQPYADERYAVWFTYEENHEAAEHVQGEICEAICRAALETVKS